MQSVLSVTVPATNLRLTTVEAYRLAIGSTDDSADLQIDEQILRVSSASARYIGVREDQNGRVTLGRETCVETFRDFTRNSNEPAPLLLSRFPTASFTSIVLDGTTLTSGTDFEFVASVGMLYRLSGDCRTWWCGQKIVATYVAGWLLPEDTGRNLPEDIEDAAIAAVSASQSMRSRDPLLKAESVVGVGSMDYAVGGSGDWSGGLPPSATMLLDSYRRIAFG